MKITTFYQLSEADKNQLINAERSKHQQQTKYDRPSESVIFFSPMNLIDLEELVKDLTEPESKPQFIRRTVKRISEIAKKNNYQEIVAVCKSFATGDSTRTEIANIVHAKIDEVNRQTNLKNKVQEFADLNGTTISELLEILKT